jgi:uncharacterized membrane protein required for colicin V production
MSDNLILDLCLLAILVVAAVLGAKRGFFKSISGIAGTVIGFIVAKLYCVPLSAYIEKPIYPFFNSLFSKVNVQDAFASAARIAAQGLGSVKETLAETGLPKFVVSTAVQAISDLSGGLSGFAEKYSDPAYVGALAESAAKAMAPILTFVILFILVKLAVSLLCRLLSANIPILKTINHTAGFLLGLLSGLLIVVLLCWGIKLFAPEQGGILSLETFKSSVIGGIIIKTLW